MKELVKSGSKSFLHQSLWIDHLTVDQEAINPISARTHTFW